MVEMTYWTPEKAAYQAKGRKASNIVFQAIREGLLTPPDTCELCGRKPSLSIPNRRPIYAHHWRGYDYPLDVWWICPSCNTRLTGEKYHNGTVTKEQVRFIVTKEKVYTQPAITRVSRRCLAIVPATGKRCQLRTTRGYYCHTHKVMEKVN